MGGGSGMGSPAPSQHPRVTPTPQQGPVAPRAAGWVQKCAADGAGTGSKWGQEATGPAPAGQPPNPAVLSLPLALLLLLCVCPLIRRQQSIRPSTRREQSDFSESERNRKKKKIKVSEGARRGFPRQQSVLGHVGGDFGGVQVGPSSQSIAGGALVGLRLL